MFPPRPAHLLRPLSLIPGGLVARVTAELTNHLLREALTDGELDGLEGQRLRVDISEPTLRLHLTVRGGRIRPASAGEPAVTIRARAEDLLLVAAQRSDPDTLFFQRRLSVSGDTALALTVKNVLDAAVFEGRLKPLDPLLQRLADAVPPYSGSGRQSMPAPPNQ